MKNSMVVKAVLVISGLIAVVVGLVVLFQPIPLYALNGIDLSGKVNLLNEIRPAGGAILACGILILSGAFIARLAFTAIVISTLLYLSYGFSRILSIVVDGMPAETLLQATILEIVIGLICVFVFLRYRDSQQESY